jgi:dTDP-glucose 4,6-dehydratase
MSGAKPASATRALRRVLVTGGSGFIGSNFINTLFAEEGGGDGDGLECVVNLDLLTDVADEANVDECVRADARYACVRGDVGNRDLVRFILATYRIDAVVHFAAQSHVDKAFADPAACLRDNAEGTLALVQACHAYGGALQAFLHISTDEVYGDTGSARVDETSMLRPTNAYSAAKAAAEHLAWCFYKCYGFPLLITRSNNVYGPRQFHEKVVPKFIGQARRGEPFTLQGDGEQVRSWLHVDDACSAVRCVFRGGRLGETYNIGTDFELSVRDLAHTIASVVSGSSAEPEFTSVIDRPYNDQRYHIAFDKIRDELGWQQRVPFVQGIGATVAWYLARTEGGGASAHASEK